MLCSPLFFVSILMGIAAVQSEPIPVNALASRAGPASTSPECSNPPFDSCSFYSDCLESRYQCGSQGYPIGYGQHFCEKFTDNRDLFDAAGQEWMVNTMHCLQLALVSDAIDADATTCPALSSQAFGTHAECYLDNGVCSLGIHDWEAILEIVQLKTLFMNWDAFKSSVQAAAGCGKYFAFLVAKDLF